MPREPKSIQVQITITPTKGTTQTHKPSVMGPTVGNALAAAGVSAGNHDITVNGQPAELSTPIADGDQINLAERIRGA